MTAQALGDKVKIKVEFSKGDLVSKGGIVMPTNDAPYFKGDIVSVGSDVLSVVAGEGVLYEKAIMFEIEEDGILYHFVREGNLIAKV